MPQASPFMLHGQSEIAPPVIAQTIVSEDVHARMDRLEQHIRMSNSSIIWDDSDGQWPVYWPSLGCPISRGTRALVVLAFTSDFTTQ